MTIITTQSRITYAGDNVTTGFPIPFEFFLNGDITAAKTGVGGAITTLVQNVDYTLSGAGVVGGGSATKTTPLLTGETLALFLNPPINQQSHYISNSPFPAGTLENDIDRQTQISQRLQDQITYSVRAPDADASPGMILPPAAQRALMYAAFDASGNITATPALPGTANTQASLGLALYPRTALESSAGVTPTFYFYPQGEWFRYAATGNGTTDDTGPCQSALNVGGYSRARYGTYLVTGLTINLPNVQLIGDTPSQNSLANCTIIKGSAATTTCLTVTAGVTGGLIKGLLFDRAVVASAGTGLTVGSNVTIDLENLRAQNQFDGFNLGSTNFARAYNCNATNNYRHGFFLNNTAGAYTPVQWVLDTCISETNNGWGFLSNALAGDPGSNVTGPRYDTCGTFANNLGGYAFQGAFHWNDVTAVATYSSTDGGPGWVFDNTGTSIVLNACFAELAGIGATGRNLTTAASHNGAGLLFETSGVSYGFVNLVGFIARQNSFQGIAVASNAVFARMTMVACQCIDNGQYGNALGFDLENTTAIYLLSGCSGNNQQTANQLHGIQAANASNVYMSACDFSGNSGTGTSALAGAFNASAVKGLLMSSPDLSASTTFANDAAAATGGVLIGGFYRNGSVVQVRVV